MNGERTTILILLAHYLPGYKCGGPIRTIANLVDHLGDEFDFKIITSDRDMLDTDPFRDVNINEWNTVGKAAVFYASPERLSFRKLASLVSETPHDLLYINSFFSDRFSIFPLFARKLGMIPKKPVVLAPRGEFSKSALSLKITKKRAFMLAAKLIGLHRGIVWQASSEREAGDILFAIWETSVRTIVAPDLLPKGNVMKDASPMPNEVRETVNVVFLSRISPMKNLDFAIETLKRVPVPIQFDIIGVIDDKAYWESCKTLIESLPSNVSATYLGPIDHSEVHAVLGSYDLFFLPTRGENFGHVIFEALAAGVPVLISDQTPWQDLEQEGVGWIRPLKEMEGFVEVITGFAKKSLEDRDKQRLRAMKYAFHQANHNGPAQANIHLFLSAILNSRLSFSP